MNQTRLGSLIEALFNVAIGFGINFVANMLILPLIGFHITPGQNLFIGVLYTLVSVARSYVIRRWFNARLQQAAQALAKAAAIMACLLGTSLSSWAGSSSKRSCLAS